MPETQKSTGARLEHAQLSLDQAKQAQSEGNVPELNEGIIALRETLSLPQGVFAGCYGSCLGRSDQTVAGGWNPNDNRRQESNGQRRGENCAGWVDRRWSLLQIRRRPSLPLERLERQGHSYFADTGYGQKRGRVLTISKDQ